MKNFTLLFVLLFALQALFSQHVLTNGINLTFGDTYRYNGYEGTTDVEPGPGGANMVWNFGNISGYGFFEGINAIAVDPATTLFADSAAVTNATICTRNFDDPDIGPYQYYENNNSTQNVIAMGFLGTTNSSFGTYTDPQKAFDLPFAYNDSFVDGYDFLNYHIQNGYYFMRDSATVTVEADAYGTITTPLQEFQNVLRIKRTKTYYAWFRFEAGGDWIQSGPYTDIEYSWYAPNIKTPVMYVDVMEDFTDYPVRYLVDYDFVTGINDLKETHLEVFPNPAVNIIQLTSSKAIKLTTVVSIQGQILINNTAHGANSQQIEIDELSKGYYLLSVEFEDGTIETRNILKN